MTYINRRSLLELRNIVLFYIDLSKYATKDELDILMTLAGVAEDKLFFSRSNMESHRQAILEPVPDNDAPTKKCVEDSDTRLIINYPRS
ncbi:hypothetical protein CHS0354_035638 [Potamilus streckersoni]|uniref:Uncharacterized protein n=1 Tax=Potamilus streckersoni TaxID=2493646 RepID=A0AAE0WA31_9BIVA|nr:hypothetical protein CHS0354_035638 [Potamilus streckersoni]